ncbi:MAG: L-aspartate oxidase [Spirochaetes bacterium GWF1_51_8]|nr:MAG: L-aspartate oxidase [Spirochaetes bacterium GWF1_51_8]
MEFDAVVVGNGIAGTVAAYYLAKHGFRTALIDKSDTFSESNTYQAQGGISYQGERDSIDLRFQDIMSAGAGICNPEAVEIVAEDGPGLIEEILINEFNVSFSKKNDGSLDITEEAAHSVKRILHSFDTTGRSVLEAAIAAVRKQDKVAYLSNYTAVDIITWHHHSFDKLRMYRPLTALGVYALDNRNKKVERILSKMVVLASGGMGRIYLHTTNPVSATGDGYAMAARAGARLINMEFTQFHPTTLYHPKGENFLISEAVRGEGGIITDISGKAFMHKYHEKKDLAPRDIVTRAILNELLETGEKYVLLDVSAIGKEHIPVRFPHIYQTCLDIGIDITEQPIPIVPAFHFSCGGVMTDINGRTNIERLYAAGEVACTGLHGANRLASTSLLEAMVFGKRIADYAKNNRETVLGFEYPEVPEWIDTGIIDTIDPALIKQDWTYLQNIMWNYVGPIRNKKRLRRALIDLKNLREDIENFYRDAIMDRKLIELRNAIQTGAIIAEHAWTNRESLGAHYRVD